MTAVTPGFDVKHLLPAILCLVDGGNKHIRASLVSNLRPASIDPLAGAQHCLPRFSVVLRFL